MLRRRRSPVLARARNYIAIDATGRRDRPMTATQIINDFHVYKPRFTLRFHEYLSKAQYL
jgi:hypothetical protein